MKILSKYITRQTVITLFFSVGVFTFVLLLARVLKELSELLVNRQAGLAVVGWFLVLLLPTVLSFSLPMAMLTTALLVFGRMSADNEITAMRASGIGLGRVAAPVIVLSALMGAICFYMNTTLAPQCRFQFRTLFLKMGTENPMALLEEGTYIKDFPGYVIYVGRKKEDLIEDVTLYALDTNDNVVSSLRAQRGLVKGELQEKKLLLDLYDVRGDLRDPNDPTNIHKIRPGSTARRYPVELDLGNAFRQARTSRRLSDLLFSELLDQVESLRNQGIYPAAALMEAHQRVAMAVACVAFTLIGIPLGVKTSRRETSIGIAISLGLALVYYFTMVLANVLRNRPYLYPEAILWMPNLILELLGLWLLWRVSRV
jgi:lipopolysaccharide export system permease protein